MPTSYAIRNQTELRADFWEQHPGLVCKLNRRGNPKRQNEQPCDTRAAFVDYVDQLARSESISPGLADRVTL
jgi:hypothetical protein